MARILQSFDFYQKNKYHFPWDEWLDGQIRELKKGADFVGRAKSLAGSARVAARHRGKIVHIRLPDEDTVVIQAHAKTRA